MQHPFTPGGPTITVSATTTSAAVTGLGPSVNQRGQMQIVNLGPDVVHVAYGIATQASGGAITALTSDFPVAPGATIVVGKGQADLISVRTNGGFGLGNTATVLVTAGTGF